MTSGQNRIGGACSLRGPHSPLNLIQLEIGKLREGRSMIPADTTTLGVAPADRSESEAIGQREGRQVNTVDAEDMGARLGDAAPASTTTLEEK